MWPPFSPPLLILLALMCCSLLCCLILHSQNQKIPSAVAKTITSLLLIAMVSVGVMEQPHQPAWLTTSLSLGLCCGALGDVLLITPFPWAFLVGMMSFFCGHLFYSWAFFYRLQWTSGHITSWIGWLFYFCTIIVLLGWRKHLPQAMQPAFYLYGLALSTMAGLAVQSWLCHRPQYGFLAAGACCFWLSDLITLRERFVLKQHWHRWISLPLYYTGQLGCISVLWMPLHIPSTTLP